MSGGGGGGGDAPPLQLKRGGVGWWTLKMAKCIQLYSVYYADPVVVNEKISLSGLQHFSLSIARAITAVTRCYCGKVCL